MDKKILIVIIFLLFSLPAQAEQIKFKMQCIAFVEDGKMEQRDNAKYLMSFDVTDKNNIKLVSSIDIARRTPISFYKTINFITYEEYKITSEKKHGVVVGRYYYYGTSNDGNIFIFLSQDLEELTYFQKSHIAPALSIWYGKRIIEK